MMDVERLWQLHLRSFSHSAYLPTGLQDEAPMTVLIFNKPYGVLSSFTDPEGQGRPTLKDYIPIPDVYPAGRLDLRSEGLLVLTDDGRLQHRLTHPRYKLPKVYWVQVAGRPTKTALERLRRGVLLGGRRTLPAQVMVMAAPHVWPRTPPVRASGPTTWLQIVLREGKKHQVRKMTAAVGHPTLRLIRWAVGPLTLHGLQPGRWRYLTPSEEAKLYRLVGLRPPQKARPRGGS